MVNALFIVQMVTYASFIASLVFGAMFFIGDDFVVTELACNISALEVTDAPDIPAILQNCNTETFRVENNGEKCIIGRLGIFVAEFEPSCVDGTYFEVSESFEDYRGSPLGFPLLFPTQTNFAGLTGSTDDDNFEATDRNCTSFIEGATSDLQVLTNGILLASVNEFAETVKSDPVQSFDQAIADTPLFTAYWTIPPFASQPLLALFGHIGATPNQTTDVLAPCSGLTDYACTRINTYAADNSLSVVEFSTIAPEDGSVPALPLLEVSPTTGFFEPLNPSFCSEQGLSSICTGLEYFSAIASARSDPTQIAVAAAISTDYTLLLISGFAQAANFTVPGFIAEVDSQQGSISVTAADTSLLTALYFTSFTSFIPSMSYAATVATFQGLFTADEIVPVAVNDPINSLNSNVGLLCVSVGIADDCTILEFTQQLLVIANSQLSDFLTEVGLSTTQILALPLDNPVLQGLATFQNSITDLSIVEAFFSYCNATGTNNLITCSSEFNQLSFFNLAVIEVFAGLYDYEGNDPQEAVEFAIAECELDEEDVTALSYAQILVPAGYGVLLLGLFLTVLMFQGKMNKFPLKEFFISAVTLIGSVLLIFALNLVRNAPVYEEVGKEGPVDNNEAIYVNGPGFIWALAMIAFSVLAAFCILLTLFFKAVEGGATKPAKEVAVKASA